MCSALTAEQLVCSRFLITVEAPLEMPQGDDSVDSDDRGSCKRRVRGVSSHNKVSTASRLPTGSQDGCLMREEEMKMKIDVEILIVERWKGVTRYLSSTLVPCPRNLPLRKLTLFSSVLDFSLCACASGQVWASFTLLSRLQTLGLTGAVMHCWSTWSYFAAVSS